MSLNQGKQYNLDVNDKECNTTANNSNESIAKEQTDSAENVYQLFVAVVAFDRNRWAIALGGKYRCVFTYSFKAVKSRVHMALNLSVVISYICYSKTVLCMDCVSVNLF